MGLLVHSGQNVDRGRMMLESDCGVNEPDSSGMTPLHIAAKEGRVESVSQLLSQEANVDPLNHRQQTPLHLASGGTCLEVIKMLVRAGADINLHDVDGMTPLMYACNNGQCTISSYLLENGAEVNARCDSDVTPLLYAIYANFLNVSLISELLKAKAFVGSIGCNGTPLHAIIERKEDKVKWDVMKLLLSYPCDVNASENYGFTPLYMAFRCDDLQAALMLIKAGCKVGITSEGGFAPMSTAIVSKSYNFVELFLAAGERIPRKDWMDLKSLLERKDPSMLKRLLVVGAEFPKLSIMCRRAFYDHYRTETQNQIKNQPLPPWITRYLSFEIL